MVAPAGCNERGLAPVGGHIRSQAQAQDTCVCMRRAPNPWQEAEESAALPCHATPESACKSLASGQRSPTEAGRLGQ